MGAGLTKLINLFSPAKPQKIVMFGLDNGGKTTILHQLKMDSEITEIPDPTIGFNLETVTRKSLTFNVWDVGGQDQIRGLWRHYCAGTQAIIYVVDSNDPTRLKEAKDELWRVVEWPELANAVILVFANKQDFPDALTDDEITNRMELHKMKTHTWYVQASSAKTGTGLDSGFNWLADQLKGKAG